MSNYVIMTDTGSDMLPETLAAWGVSYANLTYRFEGEEVDHTNEDIPSKEFYNMMRNGKVAKTSAANTASFVDLFEPVLQAGNDILYIAFSSGLSTTCNAARLAADQLAESYPDRKIVVVDSLCASAGQGLLVYLAVEKKNTGASLEEVAQYTEDVKYKIAHWFTVDDLVYLKRGGRVSPATAVVGNLLGIKPVLHVDNEGHLVKVTTARGRKASLAALVDKMIETADDLEGGVIYICNGDCEEDVETLKGIIRDKCGNEVDMVVPTGTVIGAHSGPGTMALFFVGSHR